MTDTTAAGLGRFVCVRANKDGTHRVMMVVPKNLRPRDWPATIRLPEIGWRRASLADYSYRQAVIASAARLNRRLDERRRWAAVTDCGDRRKTLVELARIYLNGERFRNLSPARQKKNRNSLGRILEWSESRGHPLVADITDSTVVDFLDQYTHQPSVRYDFRCLWNVLLKTAKRERWISEVPLERGGWYIRRASEAVLWDEADAESYAQMARRFGEPGLAAMILVMMRIGQRLGDMQTARWGREYIGGRFLIVQRKTQNKATRNKVNIPVPADLQALIESVRSPHSDAVFPSGRTGRAFQTYELTARFANIRHAIERQGGKYLTLNTLRHSAVCALIDAGVHTMEIAAITGHQLERIHIILERYAPDRLRLAEQGMRKAHAARGGSPEDFDGVAPTPLRDTEAVGEARTYEMPAICRKYPTDLITAQLIADHASPADADHPNPWKQSRWYREREEGAYMVS